MGEYSYTIPWDWTQPDDPEKRAELARRGLVQRRLWAPTGVETYWVPAEMMPPPENLVRGPIDEAIRRATAQTAAAAQQKAAGRRRRPTAPRQRKPGVKRTVPPPGMTAALYRHYDESDQLLYVGITSKFAARQWRHKRFSSWADFAVRREVEWFPTKEDAASAEVVAIKAERPLFNQKHNCTPEARAHAVAYLIGHDRLDLLAPSIRRG